MNNEFILGGMMENDVEEAIKTYNSLDRYIIEVDSKFAKLVGFTSNYFEKCSYLWKEDDKTIIFSNMFMRPSETGRGHFKNLVESIRKLGLIIMIPTPSREMCRICLKNGGKAKCDVNTGVNFIVFE